MSLTTGLIAIKGQHLDKLPTIFDAFLLVDSGNDKMLTSWEAVQQVLDHEFDHPNDDLQHRVVWVDHGWTIVEDISLLLCLDEEALEVLAQRIDAPVFVLYTQGTSGSYGFSYYDKTKLRSFALGDGTIHEDFGTPLVQEAAFHLNKKASYNDIHGLAKELGIDWAKAEKLNHFIVKELTNSDELNLALGHVAQEQQEPDKTHKPWWKIW